MQIRERYQSTQSLQEEREQLQQHRQEVEARWQENQLPELEQELEQIKTQLQELNLSLESQLLTDPQLHELFLRGFKEGILGDLFWQILRLGGVGVVIGWLLKSWAG